MSIVIINYGDTTYFRKLIDSLDNKEMEIEILVGTFDKINKDAEGKIKWIYLDKNYGPPGNRNRVARYAKGDFIVFLDNDVVLSPDFSVNISKYLDHSSILQLVLMREDGRIDSAGGLIDKLGYPHEIGRDQRFTSQEVKEILYAKGAGMIVPRDVFLKLNGFDEDYFYGYADTDLSLRAWKTGYRVVSIPVTAIHYEHGSFSSDEVERKLRLAFLLESRRLYFVTKNFEWSFLLSVFPKMAFFFLGSMIKDIVIRKDFSLFVTRFKAGTWFLGKLTEISRKRLKYRGKYRLGEKELVKKGLIIDH